MKNQYFQLSNREKKIFQLKLILSALIIMLGIGTIIFMLNQKLLLSIPSFFAIITSIIAPFFDVPSLIEKGQLKYYSLFLLAEKEKNGIIKIHGGTLFDYYFVIQKELNKQERTRIVLSEYLKGLKNLVENTDEETVIQGTSYIINERTANKVGLRITKTNGIQTLILLFNYVPLMLSISIIKKSIYFPNLMRIKTYQGTVDEIIKQKNYMNNLIDKMEKSAKNNA